MCSVTINVYVTIVQSVDYLCFLRAEATNRKKRPLLSDITTACVSRRSAPAVETNDCLQYGKMTGWPCAGAARKESVKHRHTFLFSRVTDSKARRLATLHQIIRHTPRNVHAPRKQKHTKHWPVQAYVFRVIWHNTN